MIIVCKSCRASFIVPNSIFANGPRTVRCAKCKSVWKELPPSKGPGAPPKPVKQLEPPHLKPNDHPAPASFAVSTPPNQPDREADTSEQETSGAVSVKINFLSLLKVAMLVAFALNLAFASAFVAGHGFIVKQWPHMQSIYINLGLAKEASTENMILRSISSERRYMDGAMQLIVTGELHSHAQKLQVVPPINVEALGPDGHVIESWKIPPSQATIKPGSTIAFSSSILSPEQTVTEVNLSFAEQTEDKSKE